MEFNCTSAHEYTAVSLQNNYNFDTIPWVGHVECLSHAQGG